MQQAFGPGGRHSLQAPALGAMDRHSAPQGHVACDRFWGTGAQQRAMVVGHVTDSFDVHGGSMAPARALRPGRKGIGLGRHGRGGRWRRCAGGTGAASSSGGYRGIVLVKPGAHFGAAA